MEEWGGASKGAGGAATDGQLQRGVVGEMLAIASTAARGGGGMAVRVKYNGPQRKWKLDTEDLSQLLDRVGVDTEGTFTFTLREADDGNPGWFYVSSDEGTMEAAIRPIK